MSFVRTRTPGLLVPLIAAILLITPAVAMAKENTRNVGISHDRSTLNSTFSYKDIFSKKIRRELKSGLPTRLFLQISLCNKKGKFLTYWVQSIEIVYDLWTENFSIIISNKKGKRRTHVKTIEEVVNLTGILWKAPVAMIGDLGSGRHRLHVIVDVNPVSEEMVKNIQRWITKPTSGHGGSGSKTNFFGSFVGHFIDRKIGNPDKTVTFVSQWFELK